MFQQTAKSRASQRAVAALATGILSSSLVTSHLDHQDHQDHHEDPKQSNSSNNNNNRDDEEVEGENELPIPIAHTSQRDPLHLQPSSLLLSGLKNNSMMMMISPSSQLLMNKSKCDNATAAPSSLFAKGLSSILRRMHQAETKDSSLEAKYKIKGNKPIGEGAFGQVFLGTHRITGETVAIKKIWKEYTNNDDCQREMNALLHIKEHGGHPHICSLHENFDEAQHFALVLDLINGGELFDRLVENGAYSELDASRLMQEVVSAMNFLHGIGLVHGDMKPENLMLSQAHTSPIIKVVDFGCSELVDRPLANTTNSAAAAGNDSSKPERNSTGTVAYYSPEFGLKSKQAPTKALDMWAMGVILFIMLTGLHPLDPDGDLTDDQLKAKLRNLYQEKINLMKSSNLKPFFSHLSPSAIQLLTLLLEPDPTKRISASQLIEHSWIRGLTASAGKMENSDKRLSKFKKYKSKIERKVFEQLCAFGMDKSADDKKTKGSLFQKAFSEMDKEGKGFLTVDDVSDAPEHAKIAGPPSQNPDVPEDMSLSEFSTLLGDNMVSKYLPTGHVLYREGDIGHHMYFINSGKIEVSTKDGFRAVLKHGDTCGEGGLLNENRMRSATLRTMTPVHVIQVDREHFLKYLIGSDSALGIKLREKINARKFGRAEYILAHHSEDLWEESTIPKHQVIFSDGDEVDGFWLLSEGMIDVVTNKGKRLYDVNPGEVFGIQSFLMEKQHRRDLAKCISQDGCVIKALHSDSAHDLFQTNPGAKDSLMELALRREFRRAIVLKFNKSFPRDKNGLRKCFDIIDLDQTGYLKKDELKQLLLTYLGDLDLTEEDVDALLNTMDLQQNGVVDFEEFCSIFG